VTGSGGIQTVAPDPRRGPTARAIVLALTLVAALAWLTPYNDSVLANTFIAGTHFPMGAFGILLFLAVPANFVLHRMRRLGAKPFSGAEIMTVWAVLLVASGIPGSGLLRMMVPQAAGFKYGITPDNLWEERLGPYLKPYMVVMDQDAATSFFAGMPDAPRIRWAPSWASWGDWDSVPWSAWAEPALGYGVMTFGVFLGCVSLASILRKQWVERERYPYPLVALPLELTRESEEGRGLPALCRSPLFLVTAGVVITLHAYAALCRMYPALGAFVWALDLRNVLTESPWRYLSGALKYLRIYPIGIGLCYGVNTEVLLSVWLMKVLLAFQEMSFGLRGEYGGEVAFGWDPAYQCYPQLAAYLALAGWICWTARHHLREVFGAAFTRRRVNDADEPMSYRWAVWGFIGACAVLMAWFLYSGVRPVVALVVVLGFFAIELGCSWLVCQAGQMLVAARTVPSDTLIGLFGKDFRPKLFGTRLFSIRTVTDRELAVLPIFESPFTKDLRETLMPSVANLTRAADAGVKRRSLMALGAIGILLAVLVAAPRKVALGYEFAAATLPDRWGFGTAATLPYDWPKDFMVRDFPTNITNIAHFATGAAFVLACFALRTRFLWFRFHPGGLCIAASLAGDVFWFTVFLGWLLKSVLLYCGGARTLKAAKPLFYGLIVGDAISWAIWMVVGLVLQDETRTYSLMPL